MKAQEVSFKGENQRGLAVKGEYLYINLNNKKRDGTYKSWINGILRHINS